MASGMISRLEQLCIDKGLKMTEQRRVIARVLSDAEDHAGIMRREKTAGANFHLAALQVSCLISDACTNGIDICFLTHQFQSQPVILSANIILQKHGSFVVAGDQNIDRAVVIKISNRQTARRKGF